MHILGVKVAPISSVVILTLKHKGLAPVSKDNKAMAIKCTFDVHIFYLIMYQYFVEARMIAERSSEKAELQKEHQKDIQAVRREHKKELDVNLSEIFIHFKIYMYINVFSPKSY